MKTSQRLFLALFGAIVAVLSAGTPSAEAIVYPIRTSNSVQWTATPYGTKYSCTSTALLTVNKTSVTTRLTLTCDKNLGHTVVGGTYSNGGALQFQNRVCTLGARTCFVEKTYSNPAGVQNHCFNMSTTVMGDTYVGKPTSTVCHKD